MRSVFGNKNLGLFAVARFYAQCNAADNEITGELGTNRKQV